MFSCRQFARLIKPTPFETRRRGKIARERSHQAVSASALKGNIPRWALFLLAGRDPGAN
jgi:hypothetical protein